MLTVGRYFKQRFGEKVRKIPISLSGFTCPNIDGKVAKGGCIYCKNETFSPSLVMKKKQNSNIDSNNTESTQEQNIKDITKLKMNFSLTENPLLPTQLRELETQFHYHANFHKNKFGIKKYMVYFQSFTNTYAPFDTLKALYTKALKLPDVVGMSIGTRVDCVDSKLLDFLGEFVKEGKEIWLEYGIQSIYEETLKLTNRGHTMEGVESLFKETRKRGIKVCAHLIYGLPEETPEMMLYSLDCVLEWGINGIKIHPLYVVNGTRLAKLYKEGRYEPITMECFSDLIVESLQRIPADVVVQRISAGAHDDTLLAPKWCFDKNIQMRYLRDRLKKEGIDY